MMSVSEQGIFTASREEISSAVDVELNNIKGLDQYRRLQLLDIKYGKNVINEAELMGSKWIFHELPVLDMRARTMFEIKTIVFSEGTVTIQGIDRLGVTSRPYALQCIENDEACSSAVMKDYTPADIEGYDGEAAAKGEWFRFDIPMKGKEDLELSFVYSSGKQLVELAPSYAKYLDLPKDIRNSYKVISGYIVKRHGHKLIIKKVSVNASLSAEARMAYEMMRKKGIGWLAERNSEIKFRRHIERGSISNKVAFISVRATDTLLGNMELVYNRLDLPKTFYAQLNMSANPDSLKKALILASESKVIVTDDYLTFLRTYQKKPGQHIIQLWHATGAGKRFGQDGTNLFPPLDAMYHKDYDAVTVSAEGIRKYYAGAFSIPEDRIVATGVARTDMFFDEAAAQAARSKVHDAYPVLKGKQVIMYAPTFRDVPGKSRSRFDPELDFGKLSSALGNNQVLAVCPHPVMTEPIVTGRYPNILETREVSSNDMMFVADILITDYSSVMFEFSLLNKPMAFYCYDYDSYERDFYMDFEKELPGPLLRTQEELTEYIIKGEHLIESDYETFREKYLGACDGHSTDRICKLIEDYYYGIK